MKYFRSQIRKHNDQNKQYVAVKRITNNLLPHGKNFTSKCFAIFFELMGHNQLISCPWMRDKIMLLPIFEPRLGCVHTVYVNKI